MKLKESHLRDRGFASSFASDPQELNASKKYELKGLYIFQPDEYLDDFIVEMHDGEVETIKTLKELEFLMHGYIDKSKL